MQIPFVCFWFIGKEKKKKKLLFIEFWKLIYSLWYIRVIYRILFKNIENINFFHYKLKFFLRFGFIVEVTFTRGYE